MKIQPDPTAHQWMVAVAHPGHELRVLDFIARTSPLVAVLTDGSGSTGRSRLAQTTALLEEVGARPAPVYGRFTDRNAYDHLMRADASPFLVTAADLSEVIRAHRITAIATDAAEGYNPVHDVCRVLTEAAVGLSSPVAPELFEFDLVGH